MRARRTEASPIGMTTGGPTAVNPAPRQRERQSYGVACVRWADDPSQQARAPTPQILLIRNRCTYAFVTLAHGRYAQNDNTELIDLFNGMTVDEKHDVLSLNFMQVWYRVYLNCAHVTTSYFVAKSKYESAFTADGGARLRRLMNAARHGKRVWEIPKGRKNSRHEPPIHAAVREFREETGVTKASYQIYPCTTHVYVHTDGDTRYTNTYFLARATSPIEPKINMASHEQTVEVGDIRWMSLDDVRARCSPQMAKFVRRVFRCARARMR